MELGGALFAVVDANISIDGLKITAPVIIEADFPLIYYFKALVDNSKTINVSNVQLSSFEV